MTFFPLTSLLAGSALLLASPPGTDQAVRPTDVTSVTVVVTALASTQSTVKVYFYNCRDKFLKPGQFAFFKAVKPEGQSTISLPVELPKGEWAVALTQDMNNNDKLDKNFLGIPTEPFAFSNNVRPTVAPPDFNDCKFVVSEPGKVVSIALK